MEKENKKKTTCDVSVCVHSYRCNLHANLPQCDK